MRSKNKIIKINIKNLNKFLIFCYLLLIILGASTFFTSSFSENEKLIVPEVIKPTNLFEKNSNAIYSIKSLSQGPIIEDPIINPTDPTPSQNVDVETNITDSDGVLNATVFYKYTTILPSVTYNVSMSLNPVLVYSDTTYDETGTLNSDGTVNSTGGLTNWKYGIKEYVSPTNESFSGFDLDVDGDNSGPNNINLVYVRVEGKNTTSGLWEDYLVSGNRNGTTDAPDNTGNSRLVYSTTNVSTGYRITAVTYEPDPADVKFPILRGFDVFKTGYVGTIPFPATNDPTYVDYYIVAFDTNNESTISSTYQFLMNNAPTVSLHGSTASITSSIDYLLQFEVTDLDGYVDINNNSVFANYFTDPNEIKTVQLSFTDVLDFNTVVFTALIDTSAFDNFVGTLKVMANASDSFGSTGISNQFILTIDSQGPTITNIDFVGSLVSFDGNPVYNATEVPELLVDMNDPSGIKNLTLHYGINESTNINEIVMTNTSINLPSITDLTFNVTLERFNTSQTIVYWFTSYDYGENINTTQKFFFYFDGDMPIIDIQSLYPPIISNYTMTSVLFNASDVSSITKSNVYYSFDNGDTWTNVNANQINYNNEIGFSNNFKSKETPYSIPDNDLTNISLDVSRLKRIDSATLTVGIKYDQGSFLRVWVSNDKGYSVLVFDRVPGIINDIIDFDLLANGFTSKDFINNTFYLIIHDTSEYYFGEITQFEIDLIDYNIPEGFQYKAVIPASENDTTVLYYFYLIDSFGYILNSSHYSYYSDGIAPSLNVLTLEAQLDLQGKNTIRIETEASDAWGYIICRGLLQIHWSK